MECDCETEGQIKEAEQWGRAPSAAQDLLYLHLGAERGHDEHARPRAPNARAPSAPSAAQDLLCNTG